MEIVAATMENSMEVPQKTKTRTTILRSNSTSGHFYKESIQMVTAHEKMFNIANHQGNANQNHSEISPHISQDGYHQKVYK